MRSRPAQLAAAILLAVAFVGAALLILPDDQADRVMPTASRPATTALPDPRDFALRVESGHTVVLRDRPAGRVIRRLDDRTEFGSAEFLSPTGKRVGDWLAVTHTSLGNRKIAWISATRSWLAPRLRRIRIEVDLSEREAVVFSAKRLERRIAIAIGAPETPTPPGEYYVTDKLRGADFGSFYGCCILALSGRQPNLPQGWSGGDRLAIHGSPTPTWGQAVSNGCFHTSRPNLRYLMKTVPLGTRVLVRA